MCVSRGTMTPQIVGFMDSLNCHIGWPKCIGSNVTYISHLEVNVILVLLKLYYRGPDRKHVSFQ